MVYEVEREEPVGASTWSVHISSALRDRAVEMLLLIAERLKETEQALAIIERAQQQGKYFRWGGASFSGSFTSLAHLYLYVARSFRGQGWEEPAHRYLRMGAQATQEIPLMSPGLFGGSSGFLMIVSAFCEDEPRYRPTRDRVLKHLAEQILTFPWKREPPGVAFNDYDAVSGAAGILGYLITLQSPADIIQDCIQRLLHFLVWLSDEDERGRKNWLIPPQHLPLESYPDGYFNLGLAHGIPGPLAALSLAWKAGYRISGQREAIEQLSRWIVAHQVQDMWGINWPNGVSLAESRSPELWSQLQPTRAAWCYGAPGIASALWQAGDALEDEALHSIAVESIEAVLRRPLCTRDIGSPTICHGIAGLLAICLRFAHVSQSALIKEHVTHLTNQLLDTCSHQLPVGVQDEETKGVFVDDPGFLTGASGVAMVLAAAATTVEPKWDRALLIA
jgi:lantibiotic biosynthesis protein